jgi:hypothetical protein
MIRFGILAVCLALAGCASGTEGLSKSELAALPITATMPTGSASYAGKLETRIAGGGGLTTESMDFSMAANFDANNVLATGTNYSATQVTGPNTITTTAAGSVTGAGTISGSGFVIPSVSGTVTVTSAIVNGVAQPLTGAALRYTLNSPISGNFVGDGAKGVYGTGAISGGTYELFGNKQ